jgi:hypothetical protein
MTAININKCLVIENIIGYKYKFSTIDIICTKYDINQNDIKYKTEKTYYYILDSGSNEYEYWIFESFIFYNLLINLNKIHANIKILTKQKNIKKMLAFFNITNEIVYEIDNYNNIVYSPIIYSVYYIHRLKTDEYYNYHLNKYIEYFRENEDKSNSDSTIVVNYNPEFYVNCIFLKNKTIQINENNIYSPNGLYTHYRGNPMLHFLFDIIIKNNLLVVN